MSRASYFGGRTEVKTSYADRVRLAWVHLYAREPGINQSEFARRLSKRLKRKVDPSVARRWLNGREPETTEDRDALAVELGVDPGWLYHAPHSTAQGPPAALDSPYTYEEPPAMNRRVADRKKRRGEN